MDGVREFLDELKRKGHAQGNFLGLLNILIGRRIQKADGTLVAAGMTWREVAGLLKKVRWSKEAVRELGLNPADLPPRDRERYWYRAITLAQVDSEEAAEAGNRLAALARRAGYIIGEAPK